jgi:hypothetical protein
MKRDRKGRAPARTARRWNQAFQNDANFGTQSSGDDIAQLVKDELSVSGQTSNRWHGINRDSLRNQLVVPARLERFSFNFRSDRYTWLWIVFDEAPGTDRGYLIAYAEGSRTFGLGIKAGRAARYPTYLGGDGDTFRAALLSM